MGEGRPYYHFIIFNHILIIDYILAGYPERVAQCEVNEVLSVQRLIF